MHETPGVDGAGVDTVGGARWRALQIGAMTTRTRSLLPCLLAAVALSGCQSGPRARASAGPDGARAHASASDDDNRYDESRTSRTGVYIDPKIARACGLGEPEAFFAFDSAQVPAKSRDTLDRVANCLRGGKLKGQEVVLVGHTDPRGTDRYNEELGKSRADSVADYLRDHGVPKARIETDSRGEDDASPDRNGWPFDRRVDIMLDDDAR